MKKLILPIFLLWCSWASASISFNGTNQSLSATSVNMGLNGATQMSTMAWVNILYNNNETNNDSTWIFKESTNTNGATVVFQGEDLGQGGGTPGVTYQIEFDGASTGGNNFELCAGGPYFYGTRYQFVFVWKRSAGTSPADFTLYTNGSVDSTVFDCGTSGYSTSFTLEEDSNTLLMGAYTPFVSGMFYEGNIGEVAIWNKALTAAEVTTLWNNGVERSCQRIPSSIESANLLFYVPLDDKQNGTVSTTPTQLGSATVSLAASNSPIWSRILECGTASIQNAKLNNCKINGGSF